MKKNAAGELCVRRERILTSNEARRRKSAPIVKDEVFLPISEINRINKEAKEQGVEDLLSSIESDVKEWFKRHGESILSSGEIATRLEEIAASQIQRSEFFDFINAVAQGGNGIGIEDKDWPEHLKLGARVLRDCQKVRQLWLNGKKEDAACELFYLGSCWMKAQFLEHGNAARIGYSIGRPNDDITSRAVELVKTHENDGYDTNTARGMAIKETGGQITRGALRNAIKRQKTKA